MLYNARTVFCIVKFTSPQLIAQIDIFKYIPDTYIYVIQNNN